MPHGHPNAWWYGMNHVDSRPPPRYTGSSKHEYEADLHARIPAELLGPRLFLFKFS